MSNNTAANASTSLEKILTAAFMTPLVEPNQHPSDPTVRWGLPTNIIGLSGISKTKRVGAVSAALGLPLQTVFPSHRQPEDFGGINFVTPDGISSGCGLAQANKLMNIGYGVFFIDELSTARPAVQASCLGVVDSRSIGDRLFPNRVRMLTAMNPPRYAASGFELEAPMANRLAHIEFHPPSAKEWCNYQLGLEQEPLPNMKQAEQMVITRWDDEHPRVKALFTGFMDHFPGAIHNQPEPDDPSAGRAWESHRMWSYALCVTTAIRCLGLPEQLENLMLFACVGKKSEAEWVEWQLKADIPRPEDMLTKGWVPDPHRLDISALTLQSMWEWLTKLQDKERQHHLGAAAWNILHDTAEVLPDMTLVPAGQLIQAGISHDSPNQHTSAAAARAYKLLKHKGFTKFGAA